jgi:hypothetical protein
MMKTVTVKMPEAMFQRLHREAAAVRETASEYVRQAVKRRLEQQPAPGTTLYDRIKHLIGSAEGPADLSTNPKYMEGYGETRAERHRRDRRAS